MSNSWLRKFPLLLGMCLLVTVNVAQETLSTKSKVARKHYETAKRHLSTKDLDGAVLALQRALEKDRSFTEAYMLLGRTHQDQGDHPRAVRQLRNALKLANDEYLNIYYMLAVSEVKTGEYAEAIAHLEQLDQFPDVRKSVRRKGRKLLANARFAMEAIANPVPFEPINLGEGVNSSLDEYLPAVTVDGRTLIITRNTMTGNVAATGSRNQEDFFVSTFDGTSWGKAVNLGPPINTDRNEGAQSISPDGRLLVFTACNRPGGKGSCDLYLATRKGEKWGRPVNMEEPINSQSWESQPSLAADGRTLYFAGYRQDGKGGYDLWETHRAESGQWSIPRVLPFCTKGDEFSPFMHPDGRTLYFSSDGLPGMGGRDLFVVRKDALGNWGQPENLGYPINTTANESTLAVSADGQTAYFASNRPEGKGGMDIYAFTLYEKARPSAVGYAEGMVIGEEDQPMAANFELIDLETGAVAVRSFSNARDGRFLIGLPSGKEYALNVSRKGYLFYSEHFVLPANTASKPASITVKLEPIRAGATMILRNIFYATGKYGLDDRSRVELDKLRDFLQENFSVRIEIEGHTDNVGRAADNLRLSENRAKTVREYLVSQGIDSDRMTFKGYADQQPIAPNTTEEGRAQNRRTQVRIKQR